MKLKTYITIAILSLTSCQLLKKDKLTLKKLNQKEELEVTAQRNMRNEQRQMVLIDSSEHAYTLMLWPKGHFKFTIENGFEGEAEKMMIIGKHSKQNILKLKEERRQDSTLVKANYSNQKESSTTVKKHKFSFGHSFTWLLLLPFLYLCYWVYRRFC